MRRGPACWTRILARIQAAGGARLEKCGKYGVEKSASFSKLLVEPTARKVVAT